MPGGGSGAFLGEEALVSGNLMRGLELLSC